MTDRFRTTRWSVVLDAGDADRERRRAALATLCESYWYPLYAYARRRGADPDDAADQVQGFLATVIEDEVLAAADPERGRFRGFLVTAFRRHASKDRERAAAKRRGGDATLLSLDFDTGESQYKLEPVDPGATPEQLFERRWALALLQRVMDTLRDEAVRAGRAALFDELAVLLGGHSPTPTHAEIGDRVHLTAGAVKVAAHRLRKRYRELLRLAVLETVADESDVDDEMRRLIDAVRR